MMPAMAPAIPILHRDEHLVVVDKPCGMLVVAAPGRGGLTLVDCLRQQLGCEVLPVHRLDEDTTGVMVFALTAVARSGLEDLFRSHDLERDYLALLSATPSPPAGRIRSQLREEGGMVRIVQRGGETAITNYRVVGKRGRCCLVRCRLETGRRNQIRVHMAGLGCPVAGDRKYGFRARPGESFSRVMLHAHRLVFTHPVTGSRIQIQAEADVPELRE